MMDKLTENAQRAIQEANETAFLNNHAEVTSWHVLQAHTFEALDGDILLALWLWRVGGC